MKNLLGRLIECEGSEEAYGFRGTEETVKLEHNGLKKSCWTTYTVATKRFRFCF